MKIWIYITYFFRSAWLRGLVNTIVLLVTELRYEKQFKIKTSAIKPSDSKRFYHYQGAGYRMLLRIFNDTIRETEGFKFIDIGCGKGRALIVAEYCGYKDITGIELDKELLRDAESNLKRYPFKQKNSTFNLIHINALDFKYGQKPTVYFLFNPFSEEVLKKVLGLITTATTTETWFIYMNPIHNKVFEETNLHPIKTYRSGRYIEALVYQVNKGTKL